MSSKKFIEIRFRKTLQAINSFWIQWNNELRFVFGLLFTKLNEQICVTVNNLNVYKHLVMVMTDDGNVLTHFKMILYRISNQLAQADHFWVYLFLLLDHNGNMYW